MSLFYGICAALGGTVMVGQFLLSLLGLHGHDHGFDHASDHIGDDAGHGLDHDPAHEAHGSSEHGHGSTSIFRILTVRTVVAALTFFGLVGLTVESAGLSPSSSLVIALAAGFAALYAVHWLMQQLFKLRADGTVRIHRAVGQAATVYVRIPARRQGAGKIMLNIQDRMVELAAVTAGDEIPSGGLVVVQQFVDAEVVQVEPQATHEVSHV
jgi:hypothetical protein